MRVNSRSILASTFCCLLFVSACAAPGATPSPSDAVPRTSGAPESPAPKSAAPAERVDVRFALPVGIADEGQIWAYVPEQMGFFEEEGLDVNFITSGSGGDALRLVGTGNADFSISNAENMLNARTEGLDLVGVACLDTVQIYRVITLADSPIEAYSDLAGQAVGVVSFTSGTFPFTQSALQENGIDPENDVEVIAVGSGAPGLEALQSGQVAALTTTETNIARFEALGAELNFLPATSGQLLPADLLLVRSELLESDPGLVARFARAVMKGIVYAQANREAAAEMHRYMFPEAAAETLEVSTAIVTARSESQALRDDQEGWGWVPVDAYQELQERALELGTVLEPHDLDGVLTNELMPQIQDFDVEAVQALPYEQ